MLTKIRILKLVLIHKFHHLLWGARAPCLDISLLSSNDVVVVCMLTTWSHGVRLSSQGVICWIRRTRRYTVRLTRQDNRCQLWAMEEHGMSRICWTYITALSGHGGAVRRDRPRYQVFIKLARLLNLLFRCICTIRAMRLCVLCHVYTSRSYDWSIPF